MYFDLKAGLNSRLSKLFSIGLLSAGLLCAASSSFAADTTSAAAPAVADSANAKKNISLDYYGEAYPLPWSGDLSIFNRLRLSAPIDKAPLRINPYFELNQERLGGDARNNVEIGLYRLFGQATRLSFGLSRRGFDHDEGDASTQLRTGITTGAFFSSASGRYFAELYGEAFYIAPVYASSFISSAGFAKIGYRAYEAHHLIGDPLILELRATHGSDSSYAGPNYLVLNIGPRLSYWEIRPNLAASLFVARSFHLASQVDQQVQSTWFLLSLSGGF
jgi:hypothetical protein